jgi:hypothetical protein
MPVSTGKIYLGSTLVSGGSATATEWTRPSAWPAMPSVSASEQKIVGLHAVWPGDGDGNGANFFAFSASGAYTIDFGDGTVTDYAAAAQAGYEFNYVAPALAGTECPVTFTDAGDLVNRTAHGLANGSIVKFWSIASTTGLVEGQQYYVINATANTFQVSTTVGGTAVTLTTDGSAQLLPYRVAVVTITPQAGQNLTIINFQRRNSQANLQAYATGWLDLAISVPNVTGANFTLGGTTVAHRLVERINLVAYGALTTMSSMFNGCSSLQSIPAFPGSVAAVTTMASMFQSCSSLQSIPAFPGSVAAVTTMASMFQSCSSLQSIPAFPGSVAAVTSMSSMFNGCSSLQSIPAFPGSVAAVTTMSGMFNGCSSLQSIPAFPGSVAAVTNMSSMFASCSSLQSIPAFPGSVAAVTNMSSMFASCSSLQSIPAMNMSGVSSTANVVAFVASCLSLARMPITGCRFSFSVASTKLSAAALNEIFNGLPTATGQTITITGNYGAASSNTALATAKGWAVAN